MLAISVGQLPPPAPGKVTHYNIQLNFEEALTEAKAKCGNPKAVVKLFLECKTEKGEWEKVYT